jgi:hypothetical protein
MNEIVTIIAVIFGCMILISWFIGIFKFLLRFVYPVAHFVGVMLILYFITQYANSP